MESGYNHYRTTGGKVGRKTGYRKSQDDMREEYAEELRLLKKVFHYEMYLKSLIQA